MRCVYCNSELVEGAQFCPECGQSQPSSRTCVKCGQPIAEDATFCEFCGTHQQAAMGQAPVPVAAKSSSNNTLLIALCSLLALVLVGGGIWWFTSKSSSSNSAVETSVITKSDEELKQEIMDSLRGKQGLGQSADMPAVENALPARVKVKGRHVHLRTAPVIRSSNILTDAYGYKIYAPTGGILEVVGEANDFWQVRYNGGTYYVSKIYAKPYD